MFRLRRAALLRTVLLSTARVCVIGCAAIAAGCASNQHSSRVGGPDPRQLATRVEIEDDGLPAQLAPRNPRPTPDDPTEPWSPNYGNRAPLKAAERAVPAAPPRAAQRVQPTQVTEVDEDEIIRRAIAEHEMRRRD